MEPSNLARRAVDSALEVGIVPSFTQIGYVTRRRLWGWRASPVRDLSGSTVVVTGITSGLGRAIAEGLIALGAHVVGVARDADRGASTVSELAATGERRTGGPGGGGTGGAELVVADLAELAQVRTAARRIAERGPLRAVIHNAGALLAERRESTDGLEVTWGAMVVGPHLLNRALADEAERIIWMSSGGMYLANVRLDDLEWSARDWDGTRAYAQAKRAQVDLAAEATRRRIGPTQVAMHPGWADTPGVTASLPGFAKVMGPLLRTPAEGADTAIWLVTQPVEDLTAGGFYHDRRPRGTVRWPNTATSTDDRARLWDVVEGQAEG